MKKEKGLINKIKHLLRKGNAPRYLHHFGPKIYELWHHVFALMFKENCQLSYRRTKEILEGLNFCVASKSTLQRYAAKLKLPFWQKLLNLTIKGHIVVGSIDGTGMERTNTSWHYIKRINGNVNKRHYKLSIFSSKNKILSLRIRAKPSHDCTDVKYLLKNASKLPKIISMDKGYDAEWIHKLCRYEYGMESIIPTRARAKTGFFRRKMQKDFPQKRYNKRSRVESVFHALKQKFGASVSSKNIAPARTQMYCRVILHNITFFMLKVLGQSRISL